MAKPKEMVGKVFHRLTVLEELKERKGGNVCYECECVCGNIVKVKGKYLRNGDTKSCGCLNIEKITQQGYQNKKHGFSNLPEYNVYIGMISRCTNKNNKRYYRYGARGIDVCDRWMESFENFYKDMGGRPFKGAQLDRIDNDKGYSLENCRWATAFENSMNRNVSYNEDRNVYKRSGGYYAQVPRSRDKKIYKRFSYVSPTIQEAREIRDLWLKEFDKDRDKWFNNTINKLYIKGRDVS